MLNMLKLRLKNFFRMIGLDGAVILFIVVLPSVYLTTSLLYVGLAAMVYYK